MEMGGRSTLLATVFFLIVCPSLVLVNNHCRCGRPGIGLVLPPRKLVQAVVVLVCIAYEVFLSLCPVTIGKEGKENKKDDGLREWSSSANSNNL